ncbi:Retrovirus-related Pol polyprotein from transposon 17.6, partial [Mucuna pruriens]
MLHFKIFTNHFELECDALNVGVGEVLLQEGHPIAFFSGKLKGVQLNYSTYDNELYLSFGPYMFGKIICYPMNLSSIMTKSCLST